MGKIEVVIPEIVPDSDLRPNTLAGPPARIMAYEFEAHRFDTMLAAGFVVYHIGNLAHDRMRDSDVDGRALAAMLAWREERAHLLQRRVGNGECEYIAVKRTRHKRRLRGVQYPELGPMVT